MDAVRINQIHLCSMICKNTASTCKYKQTYHDIWWYMMIARALENWLTQETTREPRGRRIREGKRAEQATSCASGPLSSCTDIMNLDDIWWYLNIGDVCIYLMMFSHVYKLLRYVCQCLYTHAYPCTVNKSMYIHVYPSFVKPLVPLASICILVTSCYIFLHCFILFYSMLIHFCASWFINLHPFMLPGSIAARGDRTRGWLTLGRFWYGPVGFKSFCAHYITLHHITACPQWVYMFL